MNDKIIKVAVMAAAFSLLSAGSAFSAGYSTNVGGLPIFISLTGTATAGPAAVTWDTPDNFTPDYVECINDADSDPSIYRWYNGMANPSYIQIAQSTGIITYGTTNGINAGTAGTITLGTAVLKASQPYSCIAVRYSK